MKKLLSVSLALGALAIVLFSARDTAEAEVITIPVDQVWDAWIAIDEPCPGFAPPPGGTTVVGIDPSPAGNTGSSLGVIERCVSVESVETDPAIPGPLVEIDVFADAIPAGRSIAGFEALLVFDAGTVASVPDVNFMLAVLPGSVVLNFSGPSPDSGSQYSVIGIDFYSGDPSLGTSESGPIAGTLGRVTLDVGDEFPGVYHLSLTDVLLAEFVPDEPPPAPPPTPKPTKPPKPPNPTKPPAKPRVERDVVFIQGIDSGSSCDDNNGKPGPDGFVDRAQWMKKYLSSSKWITGRANIRSINYFSYQEGSEAYCPDGRTPEYLAEDTCDGVVRAAGQLKDLIDNKATAKVTIVAHSMGGLVAAYLVSTESSSWVNSNIASVVTFDSPLRGVPLQNLLVLDQFSPCNFSDPDPIRHQSLVDLRNDSFVVSESSGAANIVPFYTIDATARDFIGEAVPGGSTSLTGEKMHWRFNEGHTKVWENRSSLKEQVVGCAIISASSWKDCKKAWK